MPIKWVMKMIYNDIKARITDIVSGKGSSLYYYWDINNNKWYVNSGNLKGLNLESQEYNPLEVLLKTGQLTDKNSKLVYERYYNRVLKGIEEGVLDDRLSVTIRIPTGKKYDRIYVLAAYFHKDEEGKIDEIAGTGREFTDTEVMDNEILSQFTTDMNPHCYIDRLGRMLDENPYDNFAFIQFDVECFKMINDKYGTSVGDEILLYIKEMLAIFCNNDMAWIRLTADVFMIVMKYKDRQEVECFVDTLNTNLSNYGDIEYKLVFGINYVRPENRIKQLRKLGDGAAIARQSIKGNAVKNVSVYNEEMRDVIENRKDLDWQLKKALENEEFVLYLQPKYEITTKKIIGAEALARWNHPIKGITTPNEFIPILEENGLIVNLDKFIWNEACRTIKRWMSEGKKVYPISVNVSRVYLNDKKIVEYMKNIVKEYDIPIKYLELEITETADTKETTDVIKAFKESGFTMLMDDFGSGYSSLNMLKTTPFDVLKIDRHFLNEFMESERGKKIINHTISMSRDIGLKMVAEGVENEEQANFLKECGCLVAQGYYYSKPMSLEQFERMKEEQ